MSLTALSAEAFQPRGARKLATSAGMPNWKDSLKRLVVSVMCPSVSASLASKFRLLPLKKGSLMQLNSSALPAPATGAPTSASG